MSQKLLYSMLIIICISSIGVGVAAPPGIPPVTVITDPTMPLFVTTTNPQTPIAPPIMLPFHAKTSCHIKKKEDDKPSPTVNCLADFLSASGFPALTNTAVITQISVSQSSYTTKTPLFDFELTTGFQGNGYVHKIPLSRGHIPFDNPDDPEIRRNSHHTEKVLIYHDGDHDGTTEDTATANFSNSQGNTGKFDSLQQLWITGYYTYFEKP